MECVLLYSSGNKITTTTINIDQKQKKELTVLHHNGVQTNLMHCLRLQNDIF